MKTIQYSVIGQGSPHEVYMLDGVKGGVLALVEKTNNNTICNLIFAIREQGCII